MVMLSHGTSMTVDPRIDELTWQLARGKAEVVSITAKLFDLKDARNKTEREHEELVKNICTETKMLEDHVVAEWNGALSCYHGLLRSIRGIVSSDDENSASHTDTLTHLRLLLEKERKVKAVSFSAGPTQCGSCVAELEVALAAKELEL